MEYKIVTGANNDYINTLLDFINSHKSIGILSENIFVYNLGLSEINLKKIKKIFDEKNIKHFDFDKYPEHVNLNKFNGLFCSYAFKPIIIYNEAQLSEKIPIIWLDCACRINNNILIKLLDTIRMDGFYCPIGNYEKTIETIELNHPDTLKLLGVTEYEHLNELQTRLACICGVLYSNTHGNNILNDWYKYSLDKNIIMPINTSRNNHRQDQSVLSALMMLYEKKTNIIFEKSTFNISCWNKCDQFFIDSYYKPYGLFNNCTHQLLATIYANTLDDAIKIYYERKQLSLNNFLNEFYVLKL